MCIRDRGVASGVIFLATVHCDSPEGLRKKPQLAQLLATGAFEKAAFLSVSYTHLLLNHVKKGPLPNGSGPASGHLLEVEGRLQRGVDGGVVRVSDTGYDDSDIVAVGHNAGVCLLYTSRCV